MWNRNITRLVTEPTSVVIGTHRYPSEGLTEGLKLRANHSSSWSSRSLSVPPTQACVVCSSPSSPRLSGVLFCNSGSRYFLKPWTWELPVPWNEHWYLLYYKKMASRHVNTVCTHMHFRDSACESQILSHNDKNARENIFKKRGRI